MVQERYKKCQEALNELVRHPAFSNAIDHHKPSPMILTIEEVFQRMLPSFDINNISDEEIGQERARLIKNNPHFNYCEAGFFGGWTGDSGQLLPAFVDCNDWFTKYEEVVKDSSNVLQYVHLLHPLFSRMGDLNSPEIQGNLASLLFGHYGNANPNFQFIVREGELKDVSQFFEKEILSQYNLSPRSKNIFLHNTSGLQLQNTSFSENNLFGMIWPRDIQHKHPNGKSHWVSSDKLPNGDKYDLPQFEEIRRVLQNLQNGPLLGHGVYIPGKYLPFSVIFPHEEVKGGNE